MRSWLSALTSTAGRDGRHRRRHRAAWTKGLDAVVERIDIDAIAKRIDIDGIVQRIDVDAIVADVDLNAVIDRLDVVDIAEEVINEIDLPEIIRNSTGSMASQVVRDARMQSIAADEAFRG